MKLGELIRKLEAHKHDSRVQIAGPIHLYPTSIHSYRGYYEDLALDFVEHGPGPATMETVRDLFVKLRNAIGTTFTGYKGGDYVASKDTIVWVSHYGEASSARVECVYEDSDVVYIGVRMKWDKR